MARPGRFGPNRRHSFRLLSACDALDRRARRGGHPSQRAAASALGPDAAAVATAGAEAVKAVADTAVTAAVAGKQRAYDPMTLKTVPTGSVPSLVKQPSPDDVSHQFTSGPAEEGPRHGASLADLDAAAILLSLIHI